MVKLDITQKIMFEQFLKEEYEIIEGSHFRQRERHVQGKRASLLNNKLFSRGWDIAGWLESKIGRQITHGLSALAGLVSPQFRPVVLTL